MNLRYENRKTSQGYRYVIGCDEVGRGCLAGPVVAAAVVLNLHNRPKWFSEINDSKKLSAEKREYLSVLIKSQSLWSIGEVSSQVVDKINIHNASLLAMKRAVDGLLSSVKQARGLRYNQAFLFVDGKFVVPNINIEQEAVVEGDGKILSIAAASIVAKVYRDSLMKEFDKTFKGYEFARHKGYATEYHRAMVIKNGLSPIHRLSFCSNLVV